MILFHDEAVAAGLEEDRYIEYRIRIRDGGKAELIDPDGNVLRFGSGVTIRHKCDVKRFGFPVKDGGTVTFTLLGQLLEKP